MADVKWIKIVTDIFDDEKILLIESMPEADSVIVIWFKLLCLAGKQNNSGVFLMNNSIPYTDEMFATIFRRPVNTVRMALSAFERFGMIDIINDTVTIPNWGKHQSLDRIESRNEYMRNYMKEYRENQKLLANDGVNSKVNGKVNSKSNVNALDKIREDKKEKRKEEDSKTVRHKYGEYKNVLLSDEQYEKLVKEFPDDYQERIERLSEWMASTGTARKDHLATIRSWARREKDDVKGKNNGINRKRIESEKYEEDIPGVYYFG